MYEICPGKSQTKILQVKAVGEMELIKNDDIPSLVTEIRKRSPRPERRYFRVDEVHRDEVGEDQNSEVSQASEVSPRPLIVYQREPRGDKYVSE